MNKNKILIKIITTIVRHICNRRNNNKKLLTTYLIQDLKYNYIKSNINSNSSILLTHVNNECLQKIVIEIFYIDLYNISFDYKRLYKGIIQIIHYLTHIVKNTIDEKQPKELRVLRIMECINLILIIIYVIFENSNWSVGLAW